MFVSFCWTYHFVLVFFLDFIKLFIYSLIALSIFRTIILNYFLRQFMCFHFFGVFTKHVLCSLVVSFLSPWFFIIPVVLHRCLHIWKSSNLFPSSLTLSPSPPHLSFHFLLSFLVYCICNLQRAFRSRLMKLSAVLVMLYLQRKACLKFWSAIRHD